ncbi:uncharacterized protein LOC141704130 [Apium graveolens]|uniref:uncharacterized protein LOC141704130 n=1 Tax=Apium graveolens TaxID=4045 RepID=UPI003D7A697D
MYNGLLAKANEEGYDVSNIREISEYQKEVVVQLDRPLGNVTWERNLRKFVGQWYEIASFASRCYDLEKRKASYSLRDDGRVIYDYSIRNFTTYGPYATIRSSGGCYYTHNELIHCDDDHCALFDHKCSQVPYKQPQIDDEIYNQIVEKIEEQGIDVTKVKRWTPFFFPV